jgi:hypothetical protein
MVGKGEMAVSGPVGSRSSTAEGGVGEGQGKFWLRCGGEITWSSVIGVMRSARREIDENLMAQLPIEKPSSNKCLAFYFTFFPTQIMNCVSQEKRCRYSRLDLFDIQYLLMSPRETCQNTARPH